MLATPFDPVGPAAFLAFVRASNIKSIPERGPTGGVTADTFVKIEREQT
jgi:hypothetical protein